MKRLGLIATLVLSLIFKSAAEPAPNESWKQLDAAMQQEINAANTKPEKDEGERSQFRDGKRMLAAQFRALVERGESSQIESVLTQVPAYFKSDEVSKQLEVFSAALRKERDARSAALMAQATEAIKRAGEAVRSAKEPRDLDGILKELAELKTLRDERSSEASRPVLAKLQGVHQFVLRWQDYLSAVKSGNAQRASEQLRNLAGSSGEGGDLMPRSELLARAEASSVGSERAPSPSPTPFRPEDLDEIVAKAKTLADVAGVIRQLRQLQAQSRNGSGWGDPIGNTLTALISIEKTYREFQAGLPTNLETALNQSDQSSANVVPLRVELLMLMLPRYLALPPNIKPQPSEAVQPFLDRVIAEARDRGDTALVARTSDAKRILIKGTQSYATSGNDNFVAGQNQETAGQFMLAVASYQTALKTGSDDISPKLIGERLAEIKAAHPEEFERGMERFSSPPPPMNYPGWPPYPNGPRRGIGPPPAPDHTPVRPNPVLAVPGGAPEASPTPLTNPPLKSGPRTSATPRS